VALDFAKPLQGFHDKKKSVRVHPVTGAGGFSAFVYTCMLNVDWDGAPDCYGLDRPGFPEQTPGGAKSRHGFPLHSTSKSQCLL